MSALRLRLALLSTGCVVAFASPVAAQKRATSPAADHPTRAPISIGNYPKVDGLRLNFRDRDLERVRGVNATLWSPYERGGGTVQGLALGLPSTGAGRIEGIALGAVGVEAQESISGIAVGGLGLGAGGFVRGIAVGGLGIGSGGGLEGISIGGLGAGTGGIARGITIGGLGVGTGGGIEGLALGGIGAGTGGNVTGIVAGGIGAAAGGNLHGLAVGGIGVGAGGNVRGILIAGIGSGAAGNITGITIAGIGTGAGGDIRGLAISGIGTGAGGMLHGVGLAGIAVGAPKLEGLFVAPVVGAVDAHALILAPVSMRIVKDGSFRGASLSAVNYIQGAQHGLTIGIVNYTRTLDGVQLGLINIVADATSHPILPILNWGSK